MYIAPNCNTPSTDRHRGTPALDERTGLRLPHFLIIGAPKCGTTWLHRSLMHNRAVRMPQQEVAFFEDPDFHDGDCAQLAGLFARAPAGALLGIKRPSYFAKPECPARIAAHLPQAMLIVLLRNPVDRAISDYYHNMRYGHLPLEDPDAAFRRMLAGSYDPLFVRRILESGLYARALTRYRDHFAPERILLVVQHRASDHLLDRYADVCRFLAIHNDVPLHLLDRRHNRGIYDADALNRIRTLNPYLYDYDR